MMDDLVMDMDKVWLATSVDSSSNLTHELFAGRTNVAEYGVGASQRCSINQNVKVYIVKTQIS